MGQIVIQMQGSFPEAKRGIQFTTSAEEGGHAFALSRAITYLNRQFPEAIRLDHQLQAKGEHPPQSDFGEHSNTGGVGSGANTDEV